jgi:tetratricopeptide (TPR) repeat protein
MLIQAKDAGRTPARAEALSGAGGLAWAQGHYSTARAWLEESIAIGRDAYPTSKRVLARSLALLGFVSVNEGDPEAARALHMESLALSREVGDKWLEALTLSNLGDATLMSGDSAEARSLYEASLAIFQTVGDSWGRAIALYAMGSMMLFEGDYAAARSSFEESLTLSRSVGDRWSVARASLGLAGAVWHQGDIARAQALYEESLTIAQAVGNAASIVIALAGLAGTAAACGESSRAARLAGIVDAMHKTVGARLWHTLHTIYDSSVASARAQSDEATWVKLYAEGQAMTLDQAVVYALEEVSRA